MVIKRSIRIHVMLEDMNSNPGLSGDSYQIQTVSPVSRFVLMDPIVSEAEKDCFYQTQNNCSFIRSSLIQDRKCDYPSSHKCPPQYQTLIGWTCSSYCLEICSHSFSEHIIKRSLRCQGWELMDSILRNLDIFNLIFI